MSRPCREPESGATARASWPPNNASRATAGAAMVTAVASPSAEISPSSAKAPPALSNGSGTKQNSGVRAATVARYIPAKPVPART